MPEVALIYFLCSIGAFMVLIVLTSKERRRGRRLFASTLRARVDTLIEHGYKKVAGWWAHFMRYIVQLHWYYSIHSVLKGILRVIVAIYTRVESVFENNRRRTKRLRAEKRQQSELNHLQQMSNHKAETALTPAQKQKLRKKKLEESY